MGYVRGSSAEDAQDGVAWPEAEVCSGDGSCSDGEDAVEVANSPTDCVRDCRAQNRVRGRLAVLGFPTSEQPNRRPNLRPVVAGTPGPGHHPTK
jgi:hypothetical protein